MQNARVYELQAGIKIAGKNINKLRYVNDTTLMAESEEKLSLLRVKEQSEKAGLQLNIQKAKIMTSGPITSWQKDGDTMETLLSWAPKSLQVVTAAMKLRRLLLGRKPMTNLDCIKKAETLLCQQRSV